MKILPELLKSVEFGGGGPKVFSFVLKIGAKLSDEEYEARLNPVLLRLFASPDRQIRVCLLDNMPLMIDHFSQKLVTDKIFPQLVSTAPTNPISYSSFQTTGFTDSAPVVREQTVKSVLTIISKLSDRTINGELLKCLAKTSNDEQPGIRTNTTICMGKIARNLGSNVCFAHPCLVVANPCRLDKKFSSMRLHDLLKILLCMHETQLYRL